ncbi:hypothetical protein GQR58_025978 [Nymphon striatum]|nr:hypothetical protein GQR58_025978 [Nymphon striatum]
MVTSEKQSIEKPNPAIESLMRPASEVMSLDRLGASHQTRLSFMRALLRRFKRENWRFDRPVWQINEKGVGHAVYSARGPRHTYSLVAFAHDLPADQRSDRVIATAWDATFCMFDGVPDDDDIERLRNNVPLQEAGRISDSELSLSRANRSVRLWQHVVEKLANGEQPDIKQVQTVGYLMRTTAVYGSGKFGAADRYLIEDRDVAGGPFRIEMLSVYLTRAFTLDLVEHMAKAKGGTQAVTIEPSIRRSFGVGNSTALARVREVKEATASKQHAFLQFLHRAIINVEQWHSAHELQQEKIKQLKTDLDLLQNYLVNKDRLNCESPWNALWQWGKSELSLEGQEQLASLIIEPYGELVDDLTKTMDADEYNTFRIDGSQSIQTLMEQLEKNYSWATNVDYSEKKNCSRFWYVSEEKLEPRVGERFEEEGAEYEQPLCTGKDAAGLYQSLKDWKGENELAHFLLKHPEYRHTVRRVQLQARMPYAEIQGNLISSDFLPIDMLRCKLAFFGATHFDPRSDRWIDSLSRKACRGVGYSWGLAEDAGKAVRWLTAYGLPGATVLADYLQVVQSGFSPYIPELKDRRMSMLYPLLALPQAARISEAFSQPIEISFGNASLVCTRESLSILGKVDWSVKKSDLICQRAAVDLTNSKIDEQLLPSPLSRDIDAGVIKTLESFAHKTYAPATEASRLAGAGAGLNDND